MTNREKTYLVLTALAILAIVVFEYIGPKKINWFETYAKQHKIPYGTYVFRKELEKHFIDAQLIDVDVPPYEVLKQDTLQDGTYFFVNKNVSFGEEELDDLLDWTAKGNNLFIASNNFEQRLLDTLNIETATLSNFNTDNSDYHLQLKPRSLKSDSIYKFNKAYYLFYFEQLDTLNSKVISVVDVHKDSLNTNKAHVNVIKQSFGKGEIILSTFPQAFTNYFILQHSNKDYTAGMISYLDSSKPMYYDNHYKSGKLFYTSPMHIFLNNESLKWAYYIMIIGVVFYIIFEGKRKQRAIPVLEPLRNQTVDFTRTIANMYYEKSKHHDIAVHKIQHFLDYIRTQLHLKTTTIDAIFIKNLAARSNNTIETTEALFKTIKHLQQTNVTTQDQLEALSASIDNFKNS